MKIATWNVNSVRVRVPHILEFLETHDIDVMLLQELKCLPDAFPKDVFSDSGYNCAIYCQKTYNGVGILSKHIIDDVNDGSKIFCNDPQTRYIECIINGHVIASVYVPNGQDRAKEEPGQSYVYKLNFMERLTNHITSSGYHNEKFIIGGDFNITRDEHDTYDPKIWNDTRIACTPPERLSLHNFITETKSTDLMRQYGCYDFTWYDYRINSFETNRGLRIDYIFTTPSVDIKNCYTDKRFRALERPSDHVPVIAEIF